MKTPFIALLLILSIQFLTSCSQKASEEPMDTRYTTELTNTRWVVQELKALPTPDKFEKEPYLQLRDGKADEKKMTGYGGCNQLQSGYATNNINSLSFGPVMATRRYCPQMEFETSFTMTLGDTDSYKIEEDVLYLYKGETLLAVFKAMYYQ